MGYEGVKAAYTKLTGGNPPKRIDTGVAVVTKANMNDPKIAPLLDINKVKKWLK